jgi:hypothetical protein
VFDRIAVRNVAKQIENLYWEDGAPDLSDEEDEEDEDLIRHGDDLTTDEYANPFQVSIPKRSCFILMPLSSNITKISLMGEEPDISPSFTAKITRLQELKTRRTAAQKKLNALRQFQDFIQPIRDPQNSVQPNLVTRDGALADELARSKTLGIRVAGRIAGLDEVRGADEEEDVVMVDEADKVKAVLSRR